MSYSYKELPYPYNLFIEICGPMPIECEYRFDCHVCAKLKAILDEKIIAPQFKKRSSIKRSSINRGFKILLMRYRDKLVMEEIAKKEGISSTRVCQIIANALRQLRHPWYRKYIGWCNRFKCYIHGSTGKLHPYTEWESDHHRTSEQVIEDSINEIMCYNDAIYAYKMSQYLSEISTQLDASK